MAYTMNLRDGERAQRKLMVTVVEWDDTRFGGTESNKRQVLGAWTEDSSIDLNADVEKMTDILGITRVAVNKLEPTQDMDIVIVGGSPFCLYMSEAIRRGDKAAYENNITVYNIFMYLGESGNVEAKKELNNTVEPQSIGGSAFVNMPVTVHYSNDITIGTVALNEKGKLDEDFKFVEETVSSMSLASAGAGVRMSKMSDEK
ncbi:MAG: hypothetical protein J1F01_05680 [Oscillospiraceae bacterium]|nr:hypothetical protein [Oscillospiraceae bacterium]